MTYPLSPAARGRTRLEELLGDPGARGVLISASRDPDAKVTFVLTRPVGSRRRADLAPLAVKIPLTVNAATAVEREGRMLVELRRMQLDGLTRTLPRYVESVPVDAGRTALVSTALPGAPMSVAYHEWLHTARRACVHRDFDLALGWLARFQAATAHGVAPLSWADEVADQLRARWDGHPRLADALARVGSAQHRFAGAQAPRTAVHGDFWCGNVLVHDGSVAGVVDWEAGAAQGCPLRDVARFVLSYVLYLDRHTRTDHVVLGHPRLRRTGAAPGVRYALLGSGWLPRTARAALSDALARLGLPRSWWYQVALTGVAEVAASANDDAFGAGHLELLAALPLQPRRTGSRR